jgi:type II secretory pathway pseudopilin PulG
VCELIKKMKNKKSKKNAAGFSILELIIAMTIVLIVLGITGGLFSKSLTTSQRESSRTDALTAAQAALNVISREIANTGYGLMNNGIVLADSNQEKLHFLTNTKNTNSAATDAGENITYFFDPVTQSILRHDANAKGVGTPDTSIIINRISSVEFKYFDYSGSSSTPTGPNNTPTLNTSHIRITIRVLLENIQGQANNQAVVLVSDVSLRNSKYMLQQY